jgi:hypothetical protein
MVLDEGRWKLTRDTMTSRLLHAGVHVRRGGESPSSLEPPFDALAVRYEQTGPPPADEVAARAGVEAAFRNLNERTADGRGLENVEYGEERGAQASRVEGRVNVMATRTVNVAEHVKFVDAEHAVVWLTTMLLDGRPMLGPIRRRECRAVLVDGRWKVAYESVRELWALADVQIPPRGEQPRAA